MNGDMILRELENQILELSHNGKILVITGPRQVGKTTLLRQLVGKRNEKTLWMNCDNPDDREDLTNASVSSLKNLIGNNTLIVIDEAQRVRNIGLTLKLIVDNINHCQVIASGSSALDLADEINEPLTGRKREFQLFPFSTGEMVAHNSEREEKRLLESRMIYGFYPEVVKNPGDAENILQEITSSYLYKDILNLDQIRKPVILQKLLLALALQIGSELTFNDLGNTVGIDKETAEKYLDLLEKSFVIFRLNSFSRNMRREIKKGKKFFFWYNGVRNAIINNFNSLALRNDVGGLWENFIISERMKYLHYHRIRGNLFFWRTTTGQEIDWIEERDGAIYAFEAKWNPRRMASLPHAFGESYPVAEFKVVNQENFLSLLT